MSELVAAIHELFQLRMMPSPPRWIVAARNSLNKVETTSPIAPKGCTTMSGRDFL